MKNKKGFTLIEVTISVSLLSVIMIFMLKFITTIKKDENTISLNTEMLLNKTIISKKINKDIRENGGIKNISCSAYLCEITLNNEINKRLEIDPEIKKITYRDITNNEQILSKKLNENFEYSLKEIEDYNLNIIEITVDSHKEYNIEIIDEKV